MQARVRTVAFQGVDVVPVDVQVLIAPGQLAFAMVGLPDKAVGESRERVRATLRAMGLVLPPQRVTVNLSPADLAKEGSHYDLPIALGLLAAMGVIEPGSLADYVVLGELALDGTLTRVPGVLPAAIAARAAGRGVICPAACGGEAAWSGGSGRGSGGREATAPDLHGDSLDGPLDRPPIIAAPSLLALINHLRGKQTLPPPEAMLAARLPGLLPPLEPEEALESSMVRSLAGDLGEGRLSRRRAFRDPHHSATLQALVGGGRYAKPGEVSLAHHGVLFLDELPEFNRATLEALRQPLETGRVTVARAAAHVTYPARFQLVAAMNPCRCGHLLETSRACGRAPRCGADYQGKLSGPLLDRIDLAIDVPAVAASDLALPPPAERSADVAARVAAARALQRERLAELDKRGKLTAIEADTTAGLFSERARHWQKPRCNADTDGALLAAIAQPDADGRALLARAAERLGLSARAWHRTLKVARTLADLDGSDAVRRLHIAEALSYRRSQPRNALAA